MRHHDWEQQLYDRIHCMLHHMSSTRIHCIRSLAEACNRLAHQKKARQKKRKAIEASTGVLMSGDPGAQSGVHAVMHHRSSTRVLWCQSCAERSSLEHSPRKRPANLDSVIWAAPVASKRAEIHIIIHIIHMIHIIIKSLVKAWTSSPDHYRNTKSVSQ